MKERIEYFDNAKALLIAAVEAVVIPVTDRCCPALVGSAGRRPKR